MKLELILIISLFSFIYNETKYCSRYQCADIPNKSCAYSYEDDSNRSNIYINKNICKQNEICELYKNGIEIEKGLYKLGDCKPFINPRSILLPGEKCSDNKDCLNFNCVDNKCFGAKENETCLVVTDCVAGTFCSDTDGVKTCKPHKKLNETCQQNYHCENHLTCVNYKCVEYFSQPMSMHQIGPGVDRYNDTLCAEGKARTIDDRLYCLNVTDATSGSTEPKQCYYLGNHCTNRGEYINDFGISTSIAFTGCFCGFSKYGQIFCPGLKPTKERRDFIKFVTKHNKDCHAANTECFLVKNDELYREYIRLKVKADFQNKLIDAPDCFFDLVSHGLLDEHDK